MPTESPSPLALAAAWAIHSQFFPACSGECADSLWIAEIIDRVTALPELEAVIEAALRTHPDPCTGARTNRGCGFCRTVAALAAKRKIGEDDAD